jgi:Protein of unknown function (DUF3631)
MGRRADFRGHGRPITQREISLLLDPYDIHPDVIRRRGHKPERGYHVERFATAFLHYLQTPADKRSTVTQAAQTPEK